MGDQSCQDALCIHVPVIQRDAVFADRRANFLFTNPEKARATSAVIDGIIPGATIADR